MHNGRPGLRINGDPEVVLSWMGLWKVIVLGWVRRGSAGGFIQLWLSMG